MSGALAYDTEVEVLNSNMETISHELDSLLHINDTQNMGATALGYDSVSQYQFTTSSYINYPPEQQLATDNYFPISHAASLQPTGVSLDMQHNMVLPISCVSSPPKFVCHYLRSQSFNKLKPNAEPVPLISTVAYSDKRSSETRSNTGAIRKYNYNKYHIKKPSPLDEIDLDKVVVNLEEIGITLNFIEKNPVLRLFGLFRKLNYYLHDQFPFGAKLGEFSIEPKGIPHTMSVQYQVKYAARNCTIFICDKERILNANKLYDRAMYAECEKSLNALKNVLSQFELYKRIEMEHKRGQFVTGDAIAQAQRLELLIKQLNDHVRKSNLLIHAFNWDVERKYKNLVEVHQSLNFTESEDYLNSATPIEGNGKDNNDEEKIYPTPGIRESGMRHPIRFIG